MTDRKRHSHSHSHSHCKMRPGTPLRVTVGTVFLAFGLNGLGIVQTAAAQKEPQNTRTSPQSRPQSRPEEERTVADANSPTEAQAEAKVDALCAKTWKLPGGFQSTLDKEILPFASTRVALTRRLEQGKGESCPQQIESLMQGFLVESKKEESAKPNIAYLLFALSAKLPSATEVIARALNRGQSSAWLDTLKRADPEAHTQVLRSWAQATARQIRATQGLEQNSGELYGNTTVQQGDKKDGVQLSFPLVVARYFETVREENLALDDGDLSAINAIFAASSAGYRQVLLAPLKDILSKQSARWIQTFRKEPLWAQYRLFPLLREVGGAEVVRELMWLSSHHKDMRVRALASQTLDEVVAAPAGGNHGNLGK